MSTASQVLRVPTRNGVMQAYAAWGAGAGRQPAVILYMDIWGVRAQLHRMADGIAAQGYCCLVPDLYHAQGDVHLDFRDAQGRTISFGRLSPQRQDQVMRVRRLLRDEDVLADTASLVDFVAGSELPASTAAVGCVGYCMGGRHALLAAAALPETIRAAASLHGTALVTDAPDSPHLRAQAARGGLYCGFAEKDPHGSPEVVQAMAAALDGRGGLEYRWQVHAGAEHGYAVPDRDVHDARAAAADSQQILRMFHHWLRPEAPP